MEPMTPRDKAEEIIKECIETCRGEASRRWWIDGAAFSLRLTEALEEIRKCQIKQ
jgi:hypothetical protein